MVRFDPPLRLARQADAPVLAVLTNEASTGMAVHSWGLMDPDADAWAFGIARQSGPVTSGFWVVVDDGAGPIGGILARPAEPGPPAAGLPAMLLPMAELEALAPDALFVQLLAVLPSARGRGFGTRLLQVAEDIARADGRPGLSLIVADGNEGARRLYARTGYRARASRAMVKEGWAGPGTAWLLLVKDLDRS